MAFTPSLVQVLFGFRDVTFCRVHVDIAGSFDVGGTDGAPVVVTVNRR